MPEIDSTTLSYTTETSRTPSELPRKQSNLPKLAQSLEDLISRKEAEKNQHQDQLKDLPISTASRVAIGTLGTNLSTEASSNPLTPRRTSSINLQRTSSEGARTVIGQGSNSRLTSSSTQTPNNSLRVSRELTSLHRNSGLRGLQGGNNCFCFGLCDCSSFKIEAISITKPKTEKWNQAIKEISPNGIGLAELLPRLDLGLPQDLKEKFFSSSIPIYI